MYIHEWVKFESSNRSFEKLKISENSSAMRRKNVFKCGVGSNTSDTIAKTFLVGSKIISLFNLAERRWDKIVQIIIE